MGYTSLAALPVTRQLSAGSLDPGAVYTGARITNIFIKMSVSPCGRYLN